MSGNDDPDYRPPISHRKGSNFYDLKEKRKRTNVTQQLLEMSSGFLSQNTMVNLFSPGHRSPSEESKEEYDENKAEEETKASLGERRQVRYFNCLMFGAMFIMIILC